jgi:hypothetical protein
METSEGLRQRASTLRAEADALTRTYRRTTWVRFALVFIPVPFVLVLLRLQIEAWHYYLFGAAYIGLSALLYTIDGRASHKVRRGRAGGRGGGKSGGRQSRLIARSRRNVPSRSAS